MVQQSEISDLNPFVHVRWKAEDVRVPIALTSRRALFIPRRFEAGFVVSHLHVVVELEATDARRETFRAAGQEPPPFDGDVLVTRVEVTTDRYLDSIRPDEFRRVPLRKFMTLAVAAAASTREELRAQADQAGAAATADEWREKKIPFSDLFPRKVGRPRMETGVMYRGTWIEFDQVREVADGGRPRHVKAVQEHFGDKAGEVPRETARRWIKRAAAPG